MTDTNTASKTNGETANSDRAAHMRRQVVDELIAEGTIVSAPVETAMRKVPREVFAPGVTLEDVYHVYNGVVTKRDEAGNSISSISAPQLQAHMLEQAEISLGMNVLEVGSGGYNAALLAELVGPSGHVTTVDIDGDITDRARQLLAKADYPQVNVLLADAEAGVPDHAPYDRILVTAGTWDVPGAWVDQLVEGGLLLVPLSVRGLSRTIAFEKIAKGRLISRSSKSFGFVPIRGAGEHESTLLVMRGGEVTVRIDDEFPAGFSVDWRCVESALDTPRVEVWSGATIGRFEPWATAQMWLATALPGFCRVVVDRERSTGLISPPGRHTAAVAAVSAGSLAYVTTRDTDDKDRVEFGVHAFGPNAAELAEAVAEQLRIWERDHRGGPGPQFRVYPAGTSDEQMPEGRVVDKKNARITISWPHAATAACGQVVQHNPTK
ncbi:methyltransferase, FxLD system [Saccharopolyspora phatthalungensis]|uniref:Protein-L-isoaspartate O-methyltransferase n=1 Tax=Saccharopolyspora phatthalungensis TaxID=664693 RepID=A0A840Q632_9PSEU|nr:methyltransferase, FxLD system [Saccharopolyspora phatthalungensis]MBB5156084.1 protein-L-isoaspartate(D-aspartate) O-methyltransferase [Saccharopolyspora phatthalungensis]